MVGISARPRMQVIIGRSASLTPDNWAKLRMMESTSGGLRIRTYDKVFQDARTYYSRVLGTLDIRAESGKIYWYRP